MPYARSTCQSLKAMKSGEELAYCQGDQSDLVLRYNVREGQ